MGPINGSRFIGRNVDLDDWWRMEALVGLVEHGRGHKSRSVSSCSAVAAGDMAKDMKPGLDLQRRRL
jgi:hypothetical protein